MEFNSNSALVKIWVDAIKKGKAKKEQLPAIGNLKEIVLSLLEE